MTSRNVLYRIYDDDGDLLYVGASINPGRRIRGHAQTQPWWDEASKITLERLGSWEELIESETRAIELENPRYNVIHTLKRCAWREKSRSPKGYGTLFQRADGVWIGAIELPTVDGKRHRKTVSSKTREVAERRLAQLRIDHGIQGV